MGIGMVAEGVTGIDDGARQLRMGTDPFADNEKRRARAELLQQFQDLRRAHRIRPVVDRQPDLLRFGPKTPGHDTEPITIRPDGRIDGKELAGKMKREDQWPPGWREP